ncbi:hypothetical protein DENSPDRAFT_885810 [Dentipellis sp. KUC8613]|nr:hypothetical protein DENSPDRAFT_885810 [Dentipellis sp. KUC8613]
MDLHFNMQPSNNSDHSASFVPNVPQSGSAPSEPSRYPRDPTSSQVPRLPVDPYAFSRISRDQQTTRDVCDSAPSSDDQQHTERSMHFGIPATPTLAPQPQPLAAPVRPDQNVPQSPRQLSPLLTGSSYDPTLNEAYLQLFNSDEEGLPDKRLEGTASSLPEGQLQGGPTQSAPSEASMTMAPPSQPPSLRRSSYSLAAASTSRSRSSSLASSMVDPWLALKAGGASPTTSPVHATPTLSLPTQKFGLTSSSSTSGGPWDRSLVTVAPVSVSSGTEGPALLPSAPHPIPSVPHVEHPYGTLAPSYAPLAYQPPIQPAGMARQPYPSYWQLSGAFPGFRPAWASPHVPMPVPGYSERPGYQIPSYAAGVNRTGYRQQMSDASPVFRSSVDEVSQPPPPTTQTNLSAQPAFPSGKQDQTSTVNADLPYQGMPLPPPPVDAALSYSSFGSLPQTGLSTSRGGIDSDHTGSHAPHPWPHSAAPVSRVCSRTSQSSQEAAAALPVPATPQAGPSQVLHSSARADVMPEPATNSAAHNISVPPQAEKRKPSASPPSEATQVKPQTKRQVKRTKKGKGKATEPSAGPGETAEVPTLPGESPTAAHAKRLRDARRARRFRELYEEIVPELSSPRMDRNPSDDDVLRLGIFVSILWTR